MLSERACAHARAASANSRPYFLSLHYTAPHWPGPHRRMRRQHGCGNSTGRSCLPADQSRSTPR
jgi:hypothetical protein